MDVLAGVPAGGAFVMYLGDATDSMTPAIELLVKSNMKHFDLLMVVINTGYLDTASMAHLKQSELF